MKQNTFLFAILGLLLIAIGCQTSTYIQSGDDAYQYKRYPEAITLLSQEIEENINNDANARKSFWIGESYRLMNEDEKAIPWYRKAYELEQNQISLEAYAQSVYKSQQYSNAKKLFLKLTQDYGQSEPWDNAIKSCDAALIWMKDQDPSQYIITKANMNSSASDYSPVFFNDIMVFTSDRSESKGGEYHWTGKQFSDFYRSTENRKLDELLFKINSDYNESSITFNEALDHVVYTQCGSDEDAAIQRCRLIEGIWDSRDESWVSFKRLTFCQSNIDYGHPTFFDFDQAIIFSSNDPKGVGGHDLWVSYKKPAGWTDPVLLPAGINTSGDEKFPVMLGDTLYFSSDGNIGMGGLDIYFSIWKSPNGWTVPVNLKPPINSGGDDFGMAIDRSFKKDAFTKRKFYIASNRKGSQQDDIYAFEEKILATQDTIERPETYDIVIEGKVLEHMYEIPGDPNSRKMGTRPLNAANVAFVNSSLYPSIEVDASGEFEYVIESEGQYRIAAKKTGYLRNTQFLDVKLSQEDKKAGGKTFLVHIILDPIVYDTEIILPDIFYDFNKWDIRSDAEPSLNALVELLDNNPELIIELASHTDCRGLEIYNAELSQRRAQSAVAYLIGSGIKSSRLKPIGYGEGRPAVTCACETCEEEQHQANRRTTFKIIKD